MIRPVTRTPNPVAENVPGSGAAGENTDKQDADEEQHREQQDRRPTPDRVGELSPDQGTDGGGEYERADHHAQLEQGEPQLMGHRPFRAVGDTRVVAEQQAAETGHDRDEAEPLAVGAVDQGWQLFFGRQGRMCRHLSHERDSFVFRRRAPMALRGIQG